MLQQTRVEAVRGYYARFLEALPTVADLAKAPDDGLGKLWEGLGYYSRMRNLRAAAQVVQEKWNGQIPRDYDAVRSLPGIGDYTAGAICSIAFDMPTPAVDGNVLRVLARVLADSRPVDLPAVRREAREALAAVYPEGRCGDFTQALMELGATVCIPNGAPQCGRCPLADLCQARATGQWRELPCRLPKRKRRQEDWTVFILDCGGRFALEQRGPSGLLAGLWQFPNVPGTLGSQAALESGSPMGNGAHRLSAQRRPDPHLHPHPVEPPLLPHRLPASNPGLPVDDGRRNPGPGTPAHGLPSIPGLFMKSEQYRWKCNLCLSTGILMSGMLVLSGLGEHVLAYATQGADKILRQVFPTGARGDAVVRVTGGLIIHIATNITNVFFHGSSSCSGIIS